MAQAAFTAREIAAALQRSKRSVLQALEGTTSNGARIVHGNEARAWSMGALPQSLLTALESVAAGRKTNVDSLLKRRRLRYWRFMPKNAPNATVGSLLKKSRIEMGTEPSRAHGRGRWERTAAQRRFFPAPEQSWLRRRFARCSSGRGCRWRAVGEQAGAGNKALD
jgi:hypothetical protein